MSRMLRRILMDFSVAVVLLLAGGVVIFIPMTYRGFGARDKPSMMEASLVTSHARHGHPVALQNGEEPDWRDA